jgi:ATP-dependent phosphofructokinase / diphosphate-dependent phosphofructokinase
VLAGQFGMMASFQNNKVVAVPIEEAIKDYNFVKVDSTLVHTARGAGICLGDASFCPLETVALPEVASVSG